jgi:hypothetical protein
MDIEAFPMRFIAVSDGVFQGREHAVLFLEHAGREGPQGFALSLADARRLLAALAVLLPNAQHIQARIAADN